MQQVRSWVSRATAMLSAEVLAMRMDRRWWRGGVWIAAMVVAGGEAAATEELAAARARLDAYHASDPQPVQRRLHVVCWRARDREFAADYRDRLDRILTHIQGFYASEMQRHGLGPRSIQLDRDPAGRLVIYEVTGESGFADYGVTDGQRIRRECLPVLRAAGINPEQETVMIFTNLADWDPRTKRFRHKSPYYAGGNHLAGTAWQLDSAELDTSNLSLQTPLIQDGQYGRISLGKHNSIFIGGIAHELGHALGLPHCREGQDEAAKGTALMGAGNRTYGDELRGEGQGTFLTAAHALRLASHPQFSGFGTGMREDPAGRFVDLSATTVADGRRFVVRGRVLAAIPVYALVAYLDPEGGGDYDARTAVAIPNDAGEFELHCTRLVAGRPATLRIVACHANGAITQIQQAYRVAREGTVDLSSMQLAFELEPFVAAVREGPRVAARARDALPPDSRSREVAANVLAAISGQRERRAAAEVERDCQQLPLSWLQPREARVGWLKPAYDHLPRADPLLRIGERVFSTGLYAHAPALHRYDLTEAGWARLQGSCGLASSRGGSVVFVMRGDGRELYRSPRITSGMVADFNIDLRGVASLELLTEDAGDGNAADWAVWGDPLLYR